MLTKQEFISKIETEARSMLTVKEYDDYRQAQIDDEYYHFDDGRKVSEFLDAMYPIYVDRLETKESEREFNEYRGKFLKVLSDESITDGLIVSYRIMKQNEKAVTFEGYIHDELKKHKSGEDRVLKFLDIDKPKVKTQETKSLSIVMKEDNESGLLYSEDSNDIESGLLYRLDSLSESTELSARCNANARYHSLAYSSPDSRTTGKISTEGVDSLYDGVDWNFDEFDKISPFKHHPIMTEGMLIDPKAKVPDEWKPLILRPRLSDKGVECSTKNGTEACIREAWESPEWASMPLRASRKASSNLQKVIEVTHYLIDWQIRFGKCSSTTARLTCGGHEFGNDYVTMVQTPYSTKKGKLVTLIEFVDGSLKLDPFLWNFNTITVYLESKTIKTAYEYSCTQKWREQSGSKLLTAQYESWRQLSKPDVDEVREYIISLVGKKHKGKNIVSETTVPRPERNNPEYKKLSKKYCWVEEWVEIFEYYNNDNNPYFYSHHMDRIYGPYQQLPSCIRARYRYNGRSLAWIDYSSMHPTLLMMYYRKECGGMKIPNFEHECAVISDILGLDRDIISTPEWNPRKKLLEYATREGVRGIDDDNLKRYNLVYFNESITDQKFNPCTALYRKILPGFHEWLVNMKKVRDVVETDRKGKQHTRKTSGYKVTSRWMLNMEARLMEQVIGRIRSAGIFAMLCHDGVDVERPRVEEAMRIFAKTLIEWDLPINLTIDK